MRRRDAQGKSVGELLVGGGGIFEGRPPRPWGGGRGDGTPPDNPGEGPIDVHIERETRPRVLVLTLLVDKAGGHMPRPWMRHRPQCIRPHRLHTHLR